MKSEQQNLPAETPDREVEKALLLKRAVVAETQLAALKSRQEMKPAFILALSRSQQMALVGVLGECLRAKGLTQEYVDCSSNPAIITSVEQLLILAMSAPTSVGVLVDDLVHDLEKESAVVNLVQAQRDLAWEQLKAAGITPKL
jgi:hypothetical protein